MNTGLRIGTAALLVLCLSACWSRTSSSAGSGRAWSGSSQEELDLRLVALERYEAWLRSAGFNSHESESSSLALADTSGSTSENWSSDRYVGELPHLGEVEVLIEKRDRFLAQRPEGDGPDIYIHLWVARDRSDESKAAWQHLQDDADTLVTEGRFTVR